MKQFFKNLNILLKREEQLDLSFFNIYSNKERIKFFLSFILFIIFIFPAFAAGFFL